jgi:DNA gyrase/topoisomerase IV subunit A
MFNLPAELQPLIQTPEAQALKAAYVYAESQLASTNDFIHNAKAKLASVRSNINTMTTQLASLKKTYATERATALLNDNAGSVDDSEIVALEADIATATDDVEVLEKALTEKEVLLPSHEKQRDQSASKFYFYVESQVLINLEAEMQAVIHRFAPTVYCVRTAKGVRSPLSTNASNPWYDTGNALNLTERSDSTEEATWRAICATAKTVIPFEWRNQSHDIETHLFDVVDG